jgi:hypothetical protein
MTMMGITTVRMTITPTITHHNHLHHFVGKVVQKIQPARVTAPAVFLQPKTKWLDLRAGLPADAHAMVEVVLGANRAVIADNDTLQDFAFSSDGVVVADNRPIDVTLGANRVVVPYHARRSIVLPASMRTLFPITVGPMMVTPGTDVHIVSDDHGTVNVGNSAGISE